MMTRGRRRKLASTVVDEVLSESDKDSIDEHIAKRQARLQKQAQGSDSEPEPENAGFGGETEVAVCDIDLSSSDDDESSDEENQPLKKPSAANLSDTSDDENNNEAESEDDKDWGGRRGKYYGVDTHEFEIMEDDERVAVLQEEEEEALRLQRRSLAALNTADFAPEEENGSEGAADVSDIEVNAVEKDDARDAAATTLFESAPEVAALAKECSKYYDLANIWQSRLQWGHVAKARFHLYSAYVTNIAFYFALRTDPDAKGIDVRAHPVVKKIVQLRELISVHETIDIVEPQAKSLNGDGPDKNDKESDRQLKNRLTPFLTAVLDIDANLETNGRKKVGTEVEEKARRKTRKGRKRAKNVALAEQVDDNFVQGLLQRAEPVAADEDPERVASEKRRRLNRITGAIDSEAKNDMKRRVVSADVDHVRINTDARPGPVIAPRGNEPINNPDEELDELDDESFVDRVLQKKRRAPKKKALAEPHHYSFKDDVDTGARRRASAQVVLNRGLSRYRPKEKKTPRTKNKLAYANAVKRRKGMVRDPVAVKPGLSYAGEATGINVSSRRGAKLSDV